MLKVMFHNRPLRFRAAVLAIKGDWPFLRKSMGLATGFTSTYKCHHCMEMDPELYGSYVAYILEIGSFS